MNKRLAFLIAASLVTFASVAITWQVRHANDLQEEHSSLLQCLLRGEQLAGISDILERDEQNIPFSRNCQFFDLVLPKDAHVFMANMVGPTNYGKIGHYLLETYYLFPREVGTSLDHISHETKDGFLGRTSISGEEILTNGYDLVLVINTNGMAYRLLHNLPLREPVNPDWFDSTSDRVTAFLLPVLTALSGMWLFRFLFRPLSRRLPLLEQLACALGLGMMAVAAITLGIKLCGFHGRGLILVMTAVGSIAEIWRNRKVLLTKLSDGCGKLTRRPVTAIFMIIGLLVFLVLFRLAGLESLVDGDATRWMLKAKIMHLYSGRELVEWFSNPRLAYMHLDYPTLVPSLHAATYDSIGHMDEFVTKFWPTWMLLFLFTALASQNRAANHWRYVSLFVLLGWLLLPATQSYVHWEGSTMPMIFFTVMGFVQCAFWLVEKDRARLGLGLTFLFGGAMTHFEGFIILTLAGGWLGMLLLKQTSLKRPTPVWRVLMLWMLAALPFICLRFQIPSLHYESGWASYALQNPGSTLSHWPGVFLILLARIFMNADFANWIAADGRIHWIGKWDGLSSLFNQSTLGLPWLCLLLTMVLWWAIPARRQVMIWILVMFIGTAAAISGVFTSLITVDSLDGVVGLCEDLCGGRYILPVLLGWFATIMALFFADLPSSATGPAPATTVTASSIPAAISDRSPPVLVGGYWLVVGALLILIYGVFILPDNQSALPENLPQNPASTSPADGSKTNLSERDDAQTQMERAFQLDKAGRYTEALQAYREAARLRPNDPVTLNNLAWSLATNPKPELRNGKEAVQLAGKAVELTGQQEPVCIGTLAAAYAEDGQFAKAVEMARRARDIAQTAGLTEVALKNDELLKLYSAGKAIGLTNRP